MISSSQIFFLHFFKRDISSAVVSMASITSIRSGTPQERSMHDMKGLPDWILAFMAEIQQSRQN